MGSAITTPLCSCH